ARAGFLAEEALHDAVLEAVERNDGDAAAGSQRLDGLRERSLETAELVVDLDAQRLERARRGMNLRTTRPPARNRPRDEVRELESSPERPARARACDRARDAICEPLAGEIPEAPGQRRLALLVHDVGGRARDPRIHAHVQRAV